MEEVMLTTSDNPFDPFIQFDEWFAYDESSGYHTCSYLARITKSSDELSPSDEAVAIESAIDEIVEMNIIGLYKKVYRKDPTIT
jgi:hypothetical protein